MSRGSRQPAAGTTCYFASSGAVEEADDAWLVFGGALVVCPVAARSASSSRSRGPLRSAARCVSFRYGPRRV